MHQPFAVYSPDRDTCERGTSGRAGSWKYHILSVLFDAPLRERANPSFSPNPAKAPWYFMGLQELLIHFHPFFAVVVFPVTISLGSFWLPYIRLNDNNNGIWFLRISDRLKS